MRSHAALFGCNTVFFNESEAQMSRNPNCFDLFDIFSGAMIESHARLGRLVSDDVESRVWLALCDEHRAQHHDRPRCSCVVKKTRPVVVDELTIVKSCKRKVRW